LIRGTIWKTYHAGLMAPGQFPESARERKRIIPAGPIEEISPSGREIENGLEKNTEKELEVIKTIPADEASDFCGELSLIQYVSLLISLDKDLRGSLQSSRSFYEFFQSKKPERDRRTTDLRTWATNNGNIPQVAGTAWKLSFPKKTSILIIMR